MRRVVGSVIAIAATLSVGSPAHAWGPQGHRVITRVAQDRLMPKAAAAIRDLLNEGDTLVDICNWADHEGHDVVPNSAPWHYVNVPIDAPQYDEKFCGRGGCVVTKIKHYKGVLASKDASRRDRQLALLFLVHLIEDVHQPMHVGDHDDRGGNLTQIQFFGEGTNLHRVWDSGLIHRIGGNDKAWVGRVTPLITPERVKAWSGGTVEDWANESLKAAKRAYYYPRGARAPMPSGTTLGPDYVKFAEPILRERIAQAGVRLAHELNEIFK